MRGDQAGSRLTAFGRPPTMGRRDRARRAEQRAPGVQIQPAGALSPVRADSRGEILTKGRARREGEVMKKQDMMKEMDGCFLCEQPGKAKRFSFYSGVLKGGTTHRMLSCTVTFFERWSDLTLHDIGVCRDCQLRLWRQKQFLPMVLSGSGAGVVALLALVPLILQLGTAGFVGAALAAVIALALGGVFAFYLRRYRARKPKRDQVEPLIIEEASAKLSYRGRAYLTMEQFMERQDRGVFE